MDTGLYDCYRDTHVSSCSQESSQGVTKGVTKQCCKRTMLDCGMAGGVPTHSEAWGSPHYDMQFHDNIRARRVKIGSDPYRQALVNLS